MTEQSQLDAFIDCLHVLQALPPKLRGDVVEALLSFKRQSGHLLACPRPHPAAVERVATAIACEPTGLCDYEGCFADADIRIKTQVFCGHHAADALLADMPAADRAALVAIHISSDELATAEANQ